MGLDSVCEEVVDTVTRRCAMQLKKLEKSLVYEHCAGSKSSGHGQFPGGLCGRAPIGNTGGLAPSAGAVVTDLILANLSALDPGICVNRELSCLPKVQFIRQCANSVLFATKQKQNKKHTSHIHKKGRHTLLLSVISLRRPGLSGLRGLRGAQTGRHKLGNSKMK